MRIPGLIFVALFLVLVAGTIWRAGAERSEPWVRVVQGVFTCFAILLAGYLYFLERRSKPHADVSQTAQAVSLGDNIVAIEAAVTVKNLGTQLLEISRVNSRAQALDVKLLGVDNLAYLQGDKYWKASGTVDGEAREVFNGSELRWRQLKVYKDDVDHEIEPGETDLLTITFVFPCPAAQFVRIATDVSKPGVEAAAKTDDADKTKTRKLAWKTRTIVDLKQLCPSSSEAEQSKS